jgi:hypothetical protein
MAGPGHHQIDLSVASGRQESLDANWKGATLTVWGVADTVEGNGPARGYFRNVHANGDIDYGTNEYTVSPSGSEATVSGTWRFTGGTGKFSKVSGNGVFNARQTSPNDASGTWSGTYDLS